MKCSPLIALYVSSCFMQSLCAALMLNCSLTDKLLAKTKEIQNNFHSAFSQCFNSLKSLDIFFLFRFFVSFSFTSSFVEFLHIIRREKASQKAHSHHQDKHYRTGSLSQGEGKGVGEGLYSEGCAKKAGPGMKRACSKVSTTSKEKKRRARRAPLSL